MMKMADESLTNGRAWLSIPTTTDSGVTNAPDYLPAYSKTDSGIDFGICKAHF